MEPAKMDILHSIQISLRDYHQREAYPVIVVDEAQTIKDEDLLEEIRLLLNIEIEEIILFTLILLGQPDLEERIERIPHLKQRIPIRYRLSPLGKEETKEYINYRLK